MDFKQMHNVIEQSGNGGITLVDAIGNHIEIPMTFCRTFLVCAGALLHP
jgi:hypothetical protein